MIRFPLSAEESAAVAYAVRLLSALSAANGNTGAAAEALGMSRRTLDDHIARLGMRDLQSAIWSRSDRQPRKKPQPG
jgi:transcriptional regulator with GAF, ATPase, and Fis domain